MNMMNCVAGLHQPNTNLKRQDMFETANEFSLHIEQKAAESGNSCMDTILAYCEENYLEPEDVCKLISQPLKDKIEMEFRELNYLPKQACLDV
jgi:lipoate-protein ligase A